MPQDMPSTLDSRALAVRRFNRFYTRRIGVLGERLWKTPYSLTEARVLFELGQRDRWVASDLGRELNLDAGYLSRILRGFEEQALLVKSASPDDGRQMLLELTSRGREVYEPMSQASHVEIAGLLGRLGDPDQRRLVDAMNTIEHLLREGPKPASAVVLREHRPGDMGYVVHRQAALYTSEYGWDTSFEALVAEIVAKFITKFDPSCERCWIAEVDGEIVGSVFL